MKFYIKRLRPEKRRLSELFMVMKLTVIILVATMLQVSANGFGQQLTYSQKNTTLKQVFNEIRKQTGYDVIWPQGTIKSSTKIDVNFKATALDAVLHFCFEGKPLEYVIEDKTIVIKEKPLGFYDRIKMALAGINIKGKVLDGNGLPLEGATVEVKGHKKVYSDREGNFQLENVEAEADIKISYIGYNAKVVKATTATILVKLELSDSKLDEVQVMAYGSTSRRRGTGNITKVEGDDIIKSPIANPMAALEGKVPGMIVGQTSGVPGSQVKIQIRGRTRVDDQFGANEDPLIIIDGVPMAGGTDKMNQLPSAISNNSLGGLSPFSMINTGDIESIEVLKDADATAIYGSRGASGVILITTKKGKAGSTRIDLRTVVGFSKAQMPDLLNTTEFVAMRKEAMANDGITPNASNAYDFILWDTTRNNLAKVLIGGTSMYSTTEGRISGGSELVNYTTGGSYYRETNVYPKPVPNSRANAHINLNTSSVNKKFTANFRGTYAYGHSQAPGNDLSMGLTLAPHFKLYNDDGSLAWFDSGIPITNPLAATLQTYSAKSTNLNANVILGYKLMENLNFKSSFGYNIMSTDEVRNSPKSAMSPHSATNPPISNSAFGTNNSNSWIIEPQLHYTKQFEKSRLTLLAGGTIQTQLNDRRNFTISGYADEALLGTLIGLSGTNFTNSSSTDSEYKYAAYFGRISYDYNNTYLLNISGRRDGSSRFGPNFKYSSFAAIGAAWVFTNESFVTDLTKDVLSFGKLRASYGNTGNDKIGNYEYMSKYETQVWGPTYSDSLALYPKDLFKPDLHWERKNKLEVAIELGFLKDRFLVQAAWYRDRSSDPLVQYPLPYTTGFTAVTANLNGVLVQNQGLELSVDTRNIRKKDFEWRTSFNITFPENKLLKYPGLENSTYRNKYTIGKSLDMVNSSNFLGVDPKTGLYKVQDLNGNGKYDIVAINGDMTAKFNTEPEFYGGLKNDFRYRSFSLSIFMNFNKEWTRNWRTMPATGSVGAFNTGNVPRYVLKRWRKEGDVTDVQKFTTKSYTATMLDGSYAVHSSDALYENIFYARLRTVELMYLLPQPVAKRIGIAGANFFLQAQNLFTFSPFRGTDPQTVFITGLAPLRTMVMGAQVSF